MLTLVVVGWYYHVIAILIAQILIVMFYAHNLMSIEIKWLWSAKNMLGHYATYTIILIKNIV